MSVNPVDFLVFAEDVLERNDEISFRNSISRAYYSLYHSTCLSLKFCPATSHAGVISYLQSNYENKKERFDNMTMRRLSALLAQTKKQRQIADYDLQHKIDVSDAKSTILTVKRGIQLL